MIKKQENWNLSYKNKILQSINNTVKTMSKINKDCIIHLIKSNSFKIVLGGISTN